MTKREAYLSVIKGEITEEVIQYFEKEIQKIEAKEEKRKSTLTPHQIENEEIKSQILSFFVNFEGAHFIEEIISGLEISRQRGSILCNQLVKEGKLSQKDEVVKGKGKRKLYFLPKKD